VRIVSRLQTEPRKPPTTRGGGGSGRGGSSGGFGDFAASRRPPPAAAALIKWQIDEALGLNSQMHAGKLEEDSSLSGQPMSPSTATPTLKSRLCVCVCGFEDPSFLRSLASSTAFFHQEKRVSQRNEVLYGQDMGITYRYLFTDLLF